ncbi:MAG: VOC family protein [Candidatus Omnitrophica bacterium]|nr:VOC family protein [Candidatus Omnitrophota bacterium]
MRFTVEHIGLAARDSAALKDWYVGTLGAELVFDNGQTPPAFLLRMPGGPMVEIYQGDQALAETAKNTLAGWRHLALRVESLGLARAELAARGIVFTDQAKPAGGGGQVLFFKDAEGNLLHLVERPKDSPIR